MSEEKSCRTCKFLKRTFCTSDLYCIHGSSWDSISKLIDENPIKASDPINHPTHYTSHKSNIECIQVTEHMGFCLGNAIKYIWRADLKGNALEDLQKARWYIDREIAKRNGGKL